LPEPLKIGDYVAIVRMLMNRFGKAQAYFEFSVGSRKETLAKLTGKEEFDISLNVSPYMIEMPMRPGAMRHVTVRIRNNEKKTIDAVIKLEQATMELNGSLTYTDNAQAFKSKEWIDVTPESLTIEALHTKALKVKISVPEDYKTAFKSTHVLRIKAYPKEKKSSEKGGWGSLGEYPVLISTYDALAKPASLEISKFEIIRPTPDQNPTALVLRVKNSGEKLGRIMGKISVLRISGKEISYMDIGTMQPEIILPGSGREFRAEMPTLNQGNFKIIASLNLDRKGNEVLHEEMTFKAIGVSLATLK